MNLTKDCEQILEVLRANPLAHIVAHSLSALLIEWLIQNDKLEVGNRSVTYIAPAFVPRNRPSKFVGLIAKGGGANIPIPSLAPVKTRARSFVQLGVYHEIILLNEEVELSECVRKVIVDKKDEMLNIKFLKQLPNLELVRENRFPHHRAYDSLKRVIDQSS